MRKKIVTRILKKRSIWAYLYLIERAVFLYFDEESLHLACEQLNLMCVVNRLWSAEQSFGQEASV